MNVGLAADPTPPMPAQGRPVRAANPLVVTFTRDYASDNFPRKFRKQARLERGQALYSGIT